MDVHVLYECIHNDKESCDICFELVECDLNLALLFYFHLQKQLQFHVKALRTQPWLEETVPSFMD